MKSTNTTTIRTEWIDSILDVTRFILHHTSLEYDGINHVTYVHYRGPKGWSISSSIPHPVMVNAPPSEEQHMNDRPDEPTDMTVIE